MSTPRTLSLGAFVFALCVPAIAQTPEDAPHTTVPTSPRVRDLSDPSQLVLPMPRASARPLAPADWMAPVHTGDADPAGGEYGIWAAGPDYKASFHDGFAFYPVLGPTYPENLPLIWHTESITAGGERVELAADAPPHHTDWRVEYRYGPVTEAYDVLPSGVEQTFVLHRPPAHSGDVVVTGRITTPLEARGVAGAHTSLSFSDRGGTEILRYGAAFAIDAAGRHTEVATTFDGARIALTLPAGWLAGAVYPVTLDPLTSSVIVANWGGTTGGQPSFPDVVRNDDVNELYVSYSRVSSGSDYDTYVRVTQDDFSGSTLLYTDVNANWSTRYNQVAFVSASGRFAVGLGREFPASSQAQVRAYVHDVGNATLNSGVTLFLIPPSGQQDQTPSIGGTWGFASGTSAYMVFRRDIGSGSPNSNNSEVWGVPVDCATPGNAPSFGAPVNLETSALADYDAEWPSVTQYSGGGSLSWIAVWQEYNNAIANDDWDVITQRIESDGSLAGRSFFGPATATTHKVRPKVAGLGERYAVTYTELDNTAKTGTPWGDTISAQRFDWAENSSVPSKQDPHDVATAVSVSLTTGDGNRSISYDDNTESHWAVAWHSTSFDVSVARIGFRGNVTERVTVYNTTDSGFSPSITYNNDDCEFQIVWATTENAPTGQPVLGARFQYRDAARASYGASCSGSIAGDNRGICNDPYKGSEFFTIYLTGSRANSPTFLFASPFPANRPLPLAGSATCRLLLDASIALIDAGSGTSSGAGSLNIPIAIPDVIGDIDVYWQFLQIDALALWSSNGLRTEIR